MKQKLLYVVDEANLDAKQAALAQQILPDNVEAVLAGVPGDVDKAACYNYLQSEYKADFMVYISGEFTELREDMTAKLLEAFAGNSEIGLLGLHGTNYFSFDLAHWRNDLAEGSAGCVLESKLLQSRVIAVRNDMPWQENTELEDGLLFAGHALDMQQHGYKAGVLAHSGEWLAGERFPASYSSEALQRFRALYGRWLYPLVSILIPTYNRKEYFSIAFQSVLKQDYPNLEILISDDGSQNDTEKYIQPYLKDKALQVMYEHHPDFTVVENWQWLLEHCQGEYYNFLMDDDFFAPNKISRMVDIYQLYPNVMLVTSYRQLVDGAGNKLRDISATMPIVENDTIFSGKAIISEVLKSFINFIGEPTTVLQPGFAKEAMKGFIAKNSTLIDLETWLYLLRQGDMAYLREPLSSFRLHPGQDQRLLSRHIDGIGSLLRLFMEYTSGEEYIPYDKSLESLKNVIIPYVIDGIARVAEDVRKLEKGE